MNAPRVYRLPVWAAPAVLILLGAVLRLHGLSLGLWYDEAVTWDVSRAPLAHILMSPARWPHIFALTHVWLDWTGGQGEVWLRLPFALYGIASVPVVYRAALAALDEESALFAAALTAFGAVPVFYAREARYYAPLLFFTCFALWTLAEARRASRTGQAAPWWWAAFVCGQLLALFVHPCAFAVLGSCALGVAGRGAGLLWYGRRREALRWAAQASASFGVIVVVLTVTAWSHRDLLRHITVYLTTGPRWAASFDGAPGQGLGARLADILLVGDESAWRPMTWTLAALAAWGAVVLRREQSGLALFIAAWLAVPLAAINVLSIRVPIVTRYLVFLLPAVHVLLALGAREALTVVGRVRSTGTRRLALMAAAAALCVPSWSRLGQAAPSGWRDAFEYVRREAASGDALIVVPWHQKALASYYGLERDMATFAALPYGGASRWVYLEKVDADSVLTRPQGLNKALEDRARVWVAAPVNMSPDERGEPARLLSAMAPLFETTGRREFPGRNGVSVYSLRRRPGAAAASVRSPAPLIVAARPQWYFGSVPELLQRMPAAQKGVETRVTTHGGGGSLPVSLLRLPSGLRRLTSIAARGRVLLYIWSGRGRLRAGAQERDFAPGDILEADCRGGCRAETPAPGAVLVAIGAAADSGLASRSLLSVGNVRSLAPAGALECAARANTGAFRVSVQRYAGMTPDECRLAGPLTGVSLLIEGAAFDFVRYASQYDMRYPVRYASRPGDLYLLGLRRGDSLRPYHREGALRLIVEARLPEPARSAAR